MSDTSKYLVKNAYHDGLKKSAIGLSPHYTLDKAVLGYGYLDKTSGIDLPDTSQIPETPLSALPQQFGEATVIFGYANGKVTMRIEKKDFASGESHLYNTIGIVDSNDEVVIFIVGQPAYINEDRLLVVDFTISETIVVS